MIDWTVADHHLGLLSAVKVLVEFSAQVRALVPFEYPFVWENGVLNGYSSTRVSLWDSLMFGCLAMGFANVRAGTRVLMLVLVQGRVMGSFTVKT